MQKQICVTGLGIIGLPTACILATSGYNVLGVDIDGKRVACLQAADLESSEPHLQDLLKRALQKGCLQLSTKPSLAEIHIIAVPTLLDLNNEPDISCVYSAVSAIKPHLRPGDLVIIESTCPIGTTEVIAEEIRMDCSGVHVAYCPERVLPGHILHEFIHNHRIVGGVDEASTGEAVSFYRSFVQGEVVATHARTAEAVKLAENTYRDINIAYANELSMISDQMGLDALEVIRLANKHPRVQILSPGPGVGGYCITVNPWFLASSAPDLAKLTTQARAVNTQKTDWVINKIRETMKKKEATTVACLGITYKADVGDIRESPALAIVQALEKDFNVLQIDPYVPSTNPMDEALTCTEVVVGLVAHKAFLAIPSSCLDGKTVLDFAGIFR